MQKDHLDPRLSQIIELADELQKSQIPPAEEEPQRLTREFTVHAPYWDVIYRTGGTYTSGSSWVDQFTRSATNYQKYAIPTAKGECHLLIRGIASTTRAQMATLDVFADNQINDIPYTVIKSETAQEWQLIVNGKILADATAEADTGTIWLKKGRNTIRFIRSNDAGDSILMIELFDDVISHWVDPRKGISKSRAATSSGGSGGGLSVSLEQPQSGNE